MTQPNMITNQTW